MSANWTHLLVLGCSAAGMDPLPCRVVLPMTAERARKLLARIGYINGMRQLEGDLEAMEYYCAWFYVHEEPSIFFEFEEPEDGCGVWLIEEGGGDIKHLLEAAGKTETRTEIDRVVVRPDGVTFSFVLKHTDPVYETSEIGRKTLQYILGEEA